ncbi:MAG: DUF4214 domain-containing protein [Alphaproteobacteria bacterium]|nr:DUF4214 domain-containing protein [Alphaproteobacteria bacterium]
MHMKNQPLAATHPRALVAFDATVTDVARLVAGLSQDVDVLCLDPSRHPLAQIADALEGATAPPADLHLVAHARPGALRLGDLTLDAASVPRFADDLARIGAALTPEATVTITACEVAAGDAGDALMRALGGATGHPVLGTATRVGGCDPQSFVLPHGARSPFAPAAVAGYAPLLAEPLLALTLTRTGTASNDDPVLPDVQLDQVSATATATFGGQTWLFTAATGRSDGGISVFTVDALGQLTHEGDLTRAEISATGAPSAFFTGGMATLESSGGIFLYLTTQDGIAGYDLTQALATSLRTGQSLADAMASNGIADLPDTRNDPLKFTGSDIAAIRDPAGFDLVASVGQNLDGFTDLDTGVSFFASVQGTLSNIANFEIPGLSTEGNSIATAVALVEVDDPSTTHVAIVTLAGAAKTADGPNGTSGVAVVRMDVSGQAELLQLITDDDVAADLRLANDVAVAEVAGVTYVLVAARGELNRGDGSLSVFRLQTDGRLELIDSADGRGSANLNNVFNVDTMEVDGVPYAFVAEQSGGGITVFEIYEGGLLGNIGNLPDGPDTNLSNPNLLTLLVDGEPKLVVADSSSSAVDVFSVATPVAFVAEGDELNRDPTPTIALQASTDATLQIDWDDGRGFLPVGAGTGAAQELTLDAAYSSPGLRTIQVRAEGPDEQSELRTLQFTLENIPSDGDDVLTGDAGDNEIDARAGNDRVTGLGGQDTLRGGTGDDTLLGGTENDLLLGQDGSDSLEGGDGDDQLYGGVAFDHVHGGAGRDFIDGGAGADHMMGGPGDDTFVVDDSADIAVERASEGRDTVRASVDYTLGDHVEVLTLTGTDALSGTGNAAANEIAGNSGDNTLFGGDGADTLTGGAGSDSIEGEGGDDRLLGGDAFDHVHGGAGNDFIDGGADADHMMGGAGNDRFIVDNTGDIVVEAAGEGTDLVRSSVSYTIGDHIENLTLTGSTNLNATGNAAVNTLNGNTGDNRLTGAGGDDRLNGGAGTDTAVVGVASDDPSVAFDFSSNAFTRLTTSEGTLQMTSVERVQFTDRTVTLADIDDSENPVRVFSGDFFIGRPIDTSREGGGTAFLFATEATQGSDRGNEFRFVPVDGGAARYRGSGLDNADPSLRIVDALRLDPTGGNDTRLGIEGFHQTLAAMQTADWAFFQTRIFNGDDTMTGSYGADRLTGYDGDDILIGGLGDKEGYDVSGPRPSNAPSTLRAPGAKVDPAFFRDDGNDTLDGEAGNDTLDGATGDDLLFGGLGDDVIFGGAGQDTAVINAASLTVTGVNFGTSLQIVSADGTDLIHADVESIRFTDATLSYADLAHFVEFPNLAPTAVGFADAVTSIAENADLTARIKLAEVVVSDDANGTNDLSLAGANAALFELDGTSLYLRAGVPIDFETAPRLTVDVQVDDPGVGTAPDAVAQFALDLTDANDAPDGVVAIGGDARLGGTLEAVIAFTDADDVGALTYTWLRNGEVINGATSPSYAITPADLGAAISLRVGYTDGGGTPETLTSLPTPQVVHINTRPTGEVVIDADGRTLTADTSGLVDADGLGPLAYQWLRDSGPIAGATGETYTLGQADNGFAISVRVSYTDDRGTDEAVTSAATDPVSIVNAAPAGGVTIAGNAVEGATLTVISTLADEDGLGTLAYQWLRDGTPIAGSTGATFTLGQDNVGAAISVRVSYTDGQGTQEAVTSAATETVVRRETVNGSGGSDAITGTSAPEVIDALNGNDTVTGGGGVDQIIGGPGDDYLYGDGIQIHVIPQIAAQVYRLYQATLAREPDAGGHAGWSTALFEQTNTASEVAGAFVGSQEFQNVYGALNDTAFVALLYQNVLGRAASNAELDAWQANIDGGQSRAQVVLGFSDSVEFRNATTNDAAAYTQSNTDAGWSDDVYRLYQAALDRAPDLAGFLGWTSALGSGTPFDTAVTGFVTSVEFQTTYGALSDEGFVNLLYNNVLGREGDSAGLQGWLDVLAGGGTRESVVQGFSQSPEFVNATAAPLEAWMRAQGVDDVLDGGAGNNVLMGGMMSDTFVFAAGDAGSHRVMDLEAWDSLRFDGFGYVDGSEALARMRQEGGDVVFADQGVTAILSNTALAAVDADMILV